MDGLFRGITPTFNNSQYAIKYAISHGKSHLFKQQDLKNPPYLGKQRHHHRFLHKENLVKENQEIYFCACEISLSLASTETKNHLLIIITSVI